MRSPFWFLSVMGLFLAPQLHVSAETWTVRVEEPTGLYPRTNEVVSIPYERIGGRQTAWQVVDQKGNELPWQTTDTALLFPASLIPGELPEYRITAMAEVNTNFVNRILVRSIGINRVELGNRFFRILIDKQAAAIVEAYNLSADRYRTLNLVETTPEDSAALKDDIHAAEAMGFKPVPGVPEGNTGWTTLGGSGPIMNVRFLETGPLRGRVVVERTNETWELTWTAESRSLIWHAAGGFRLTAISASPYLPFDRCVGGSEYEWPNGPDDPEPPDHDIAPRQWPKLPGGHVVYYNNAEDYGALGIVALDTNLIWTGVGSRRFIAQLPDLIAQSTSTTRIAITFPLWAGSNTVLQARREYRVLIQPVLVSVKKARVNARASSNPKTISGLISSGDLRIAQRFSAGSGNRFFSSSPAGTAEGSSISVVPAGLAALRPQQPSIEMLGYSQMSLADKTSAATIRVAADRTSEIELDFPTNAPESFKPDSISLDGDWQLAWCEKGAGPPTNGWRTVKGPGSAHTQWLDPARIYSPEATWVSYKEWWYRREFVVPDRFASRRLRLQFEATDYYADSWLNGAPLGRHEGYIDPYEYDVSSLAHPGETNELVVRTWTPVDYYWKHRPYTVKGAYGAVDQKPDDITPLGITRPVRLVASDPVTIKDVAIDTQLIDENNALVEVQLELDGQLTSACTFESTLSPRNFDSKRHYRARLAVTGTNATLVIPVDHPQLWWTWDHGKPNLYTLDVKLCDETGQVLDGRSLVVGIREIERIGWTWYLNRRRMFVRGTNYYYHLYLSEMNRGAYERDLALILQMNVNLIRLHCHFSNQEFYDVADELGVLVWQDYLEAWYPEDRAFSLHAATLYDPHIRYVRNHPCIASWTTCDEESLENYRDLTKHLAPRPALLDPQHRAIVRSTGRFGDAHVYHGWYDGSVWDYTNMTEPFVSELGATCLPNYQTLIKFMPNAWPIREHAEEWFFRRLQIPEAMRAWGEPGELSLKEYIPRTQAYVSRLFQIALERSRRLKYNPAGGICHFHAIDIWPSVTMAAIDFDRVPTKVFYTVQRSFAPVCASLEYDRDKWKNGERFRCNVWAINDRWEAVPNATIRWRILDGQQAEQSSGQWGVSMPEDSVQQLGTAEWVSTAKGPHELRAEVRDSSGKPISENVFEFEVTE